MAILIHMLRRSLLMRGCPILDLQSVALHLQTRSCISEWLRRRVPSPRTGDNGGSTGRLFSDLQTLVVIGPSARGLEGLGPPISSHTAQNGRAWILLINARHCLRRPDKI